MSKYVKTVLCLAASRKDGGRCIAGKSMKPPDYGQWIRPVSDRPTAEISLEERRYENGREPRLLDVIEIPMLAPVPRNHQSENHIVDADRCWRKTRTATSDELRDLEDNPPSLWGTESSTTAGTNDRVTPAAAAKFSNSLWLIQPRDIKIRVLAPGAAFGNPKRKVRASFRYGGMPYDFIVTDLAVESHFLPKPDAEYHITRDLYFSVSLGTPHTDNNGNTFCYKLVAAIITAQSVK